MGDFVAFACSADGYRIRPYSGDRLKMPMTFASYNAAFTNADERDAFFDRAARALRMGHPVRYGVAMEHVLATNLGVWGNERALARDTAEMLTLELDSWADRNDERRLDIPPEVLAETEPFRQAFSACRAPNVREIDNLVMTARDEALPMETDVARYLNEDFVKDLYFRLCATADQYRNLAMDHRHRVSRLMGR